MAGSDRSALKKGWLRTRLAPNVIDAEASEQDSSRLRSQLARERAAKAQQARPTASRTTSRPKPPEASRVSAEAEVIEPTETPPVDEWIQPSAPSTQTARRAPAPDPAPAPSGRPEARGAPADPAPRDDAAAASSANAEPHQSTSQAATRADPVTASAPERPSQVHAPAVFGDGISLTQATMNPGPDLAVIHQPDSARAKSYRGLFTRLSSTMDAEPDTTALAVVSAQPESGCSAVAANLAVLFARAGRRVLLVDADLRKGDQERQFGYRASPEGLSGWLAGQNALAGLWFAELPGLVVVPAGRSDATASERLAHPAFRQWVAHQRKAQQVVILDTGRDPDEAQAVASAAGAAILTCRRHRTALGDLKTYATAMSDQRVRFLGAVLTD